MTHKKQIIIIFSLSIFLGLTRFVFLDDPDFTIIKKERIIKKINTFIIPNEMSEPMAIDLEFAKYLYNNKSAIFIDARDPEDYHKGHIDSAINIPFDYYEDYEDIIDNLDNSNTYVIYCSGEECSLSIDLADYLFNELIFDKILIFEGGWPQWQDAKYP